MKRIACLFAALVILLAIRNAAVAQNVSVQSPTFHQFGVSTTVLAPDRGSAFLGGVNRSRSFSRSTGTPLLPGGHRERGFFNSAAQASVHVWIHDLEAMDQAILAQGAPPLTKIDARQENWLQANRRRTSFPQGGAAQPADSRLAAHLKVGDSGSLSVAQHRMRANQARRVRTREAEASLAQARQAEEAGKLRLARTYYRLAQREAEEPMRRSIAERLLALENSPGAK